LREGISRYLQDDAGVFICNAQPSTKTLSQIGWVNFVDGLFFLLLKCSSVVNWLLSFVRDEMHKSKVSHLRSDPKMLLVDETIHQVNFYR
jgi:hypothetical protein